MLWPDPDDDHQVLSALRGADVFVTFRCTTEMAGPDGTQVQVSGTGTDKVEPTHLPRNTEVANALHHEDSIAEYVLAKFNELAESGVRSDVDTVGCPPSFLAAVERGLPPVSMWPPGSA